MSTEQAMRTWDREERRNAERASESAGVRLIVLGPNHVPVAERYCSGIDRSPIGLGISTPGSLEPGTLVLVLMPGEPTFDVWLACVAHCRLKPDGSRVIGLERREMPAALMAASWLEVLRSAA